MDARQIRSELNRLIEAYRGDDTAVSQEDIEKIEYALGNGYVEINSVLGESVSLLQKAVINQSLGMVDVLLAHGADVNVKDNAGRSALHYAVWVHQPDIVSRLVECGADISAKDNTGRDVLFYLFFYFLKNPPGTSRGQEMSFGEIEKNGKEILGCLSNAPRYIDQDRLEQVATIFVSSRAEGISGKQRLKIIQFTGVMSVFLTVRECAVSAEVANDQGSLINFSSLRIG